MEILVSEWVEVVCETCWRFQNSYNFLIGPTSDNVKYLILCLQKAHRIDIVPVNLCPWDFVIFLCFDILRQDSCRLVLWDRNQEITWVVPWNIFHFRVMTIEWFPQGKLILLLVIVPNQDRSNIIQGSQTGIRRIWHYLKVGIFISQKLTHSCLNTPGTILLDLTPNAQGRIQRRWQQPEGIIKASPVNKSNAAFVRYQNRIQKYVMISFIVWDSLDVFVEFR